MPVECPVSYGMHGHGVHRERRPVGWWRRPLAWSALAALVLAAAAVAGAAIEDTYEPLPATSYPPGVVLVPQGPPPSCATPVEVYSPSSPGAQQGAATGARVGCDDLVRQLAETQDGVAP